jgi:phospholipid-binding lipoprotein MlaA
MNYRLHDGNPPVVINEQEEDELDALLESYEDFD